MKDHETTPGIAAALRRELESEAAQGFPRLSSIPATGVVQFLDYFHAEDTVGREALIDGLTSLAAFAVEGSGDRPHPSAVARMRAALTSPGPFVGGWRYTDVRFLATVDRIEGFGGRERWLQAYSAQALQPRADLLPDPPALVPAKAPLLRKLTKAAMTRSGYAATAFAGGMRFLSPAGVLVDCDFGSRMGQLRWQVATGATRPTHGLVELRWFSYEGLWGLRSDWDYLTEENAERCIAGLPGLVDSVVRTIRR